MRSDLHKMISNSQNRLTERKSVTQKKLTMSQENFSKSLLSRKNQELASVQCLNCIVQNMESLTAGADD